MCCGDETFSFDLDQDLDMLKEKLDFFFDGLFDGTESVIKYTIVKMTQYNSLAKQIFHGKLKEIHEIEVNSKN
jgi:hypothetical protein